MPAENQSVALPAGDSRKLVMPVADAAGAPVPLSGATVRWWLAKSRWSTGTDVLIKKTSAVGGGIAILDATATVTLDSTDTDGIAPADYYHEAEVVFADGTVATVTRGVFTITPTIIRPAP